MDEKNTITWVTRNSRRAAQVGVSRVDLLHTRDGREANRMLVVFDSGLYRYRMVLNRVEDGRFEGPCERFLREEDRLIDAKPVRCLLLDSLGKSALVMSLSPWVDDEKQESDWLGHFKNIRRLILHTSASS
jgi:hypothetical protein